MVGKNILGLHDEGQLAGHLLSVVPLLLVFAVQ